MAFTWPAWAGFGSGPVWAVVLGLLLVLGSAVFLVAHVDRSGRA